MVKHIIEICSLLMKLAQRHVLPLICPTADNIRDHILPLGLFLAVFLRCPRPTLSQGSVPKPARLVGTGAEVPV